MKRLKNVIWLSFFCFLFSCSNENVVNSEKKNVSELTSSQVLDRILGLGFSKENIEEFDDYYLVDGEIRFPKNDDFSCDTSKLRQLRYKYLVTQKSIQVYIDPDFGYESVSSPALNNALNAYNAIQSSLFFSRTLDKSQANIVITTGSLGDNHAAVADAPSNSGRPGGLITVDLWVMSQNTHMTENNFTFIFAHELGHTIGLVGRKDTGGTLISGTSPNDYESVWSDLNYYAKWQGFTDGDTTAILSLYPPDVKGGFDLNYATDQVIALDYDGNGLGDLMLYRPGSKSVTLNCSRGNGFFSSVFQSYTGIGYYDFNESVDKAIALDYNGDGKDDILCYRPGSKTVYLLKSNGDKTFTNVYASSNGIGYYDFNESVDRAIALDYNGDGKDDILCYRPGSKIVYLLKSNGDGTFTTVYTSRNGIGGYDFNALEDEAIALDYNGDGKDDILCYRPGSKTVYLLKSNGDGTFTTVYTSRNGIAGFDFNASVDKAIALDYNGDGKDDILCYRPGSKIVYLLKSNGDGTFTSVYEGRNGIAGFDFSKCGDRAVALDYNHDGLSDIVLYRPGFGVAWSAHSNGSSFVLDSSN